MSTCSISASPWSILLTAAPLSPPLSVPGNATFWGLRKTFQTPTFLHVSLPAFSLGCLIALLSCQGLQAGCFYAPEASGDGAVAMVSVHA
jgi:hypothetical protein